MLRLRELEQRNDLALCGIRKALRAMCAYIEAEEQFEQRFLENLRSRIGHTQLIGEVIHLCKPPRFSFERVE